MLKRTISSFLLIVMVFALFAGCTSNAPTADNGGGQTSAPQPAGSGPSVEEALFTADKYTGEGNGFGGVIKVEVEVDANEILHVNILSHNETSGVADAAIERIPSQIVQYQSLAVDTVAGCTLASKGIIEAAENALTQANADISKLKAAINKDAAKTELLTRTADVIVVGSGGAGLSAAIEAHKAGKNVLVIDKMPNFGGNTILAGSFLNSSDMARQKNIAMSAEELAQIEAALALEPENDTMKRWQETIRVELDEHIKTLGKNVLFDSPTLHALQTYIGGDYVGNPALIEIFGANAPKALAFMEEHGVVWKEPAIAMGATWARSHAPEPTWGYAGAAFAKPFIEYLQKNNVDMLADTKAEHLIMENGKCVGVKGHTTQGQPFEYTANSAVILATGGFAANVEMRQEYNKHWATLDENVATTNGPSSTGDGILMAIEAGANLVGMEWIQMVPYADQTGAVVNSADIMYININGERFVREDGRRDVMSKAVLEQPEARFYIFYDGHTVVNDVGVMSDIDYTPFIADGRIKKGETLEALCAQINVPVETLKKTIDAFNAIVDNGNDPFGRTVFGVHIDQGPYYAVEKSPAVHHTMGGIEINEEAQVLDMGGKVIPGLFAAGETTGGIHGSNRLGGNAIADIFIFGRIAGQNASK